MSAAIRYDSTANRSAQKFERFHTVAISVVRLWWSRDRWPNELRKPELIGAAGNLLRARHS
jgi:hypothetical protein